MKNLSEMFVFSTQQSLINSTSNESGKDLDNSMNVGSGIGLETNCNAKRSRADHDVLGRHDVGADYRETENMGSFKSKLMNMSTPNSWFVLGLKEQLQKPWANALILKNMGRSHTLNFMLSKLSLKWSLIRHWQLIDLGDGYFVARFQMKEDLDYVLTKGLWVIANQYLPVQRWKPNFVPGEDIIQSILNIDDRPIRVEYEILGLTCFKCGRYGHSKEQCREGLVEPIVEETATNDSNVDNVKKDDSPYGPWLLVSYGKQGNRNPNWRYGRIGNGNTSTVNRNGVNGKLGDNNLSRKKDDAYLDSRSSKQGEKLGRAYSQLSIKNTKKIDKVGCSDSIRSKLTSKQGVAGSSKGTNGSKGKKSSHKTTSQCRVNDEVEDTNVLQQSHKEVAKFEAKIFLSKATNDGYGNKTKVPIDDRFDVVASELEEAMAVITD
ncbi:hypothetical protein Dsin_005657 [Dipteronia sinensis]|uniref:CCHC-type domain-containing protein n=1 Tax=Dipteronia sinensis TaxID=43782 RepID=A0AAE0AXZ2_9ROSI|nr:hypothetical protein Dsin_005657 [Dipteronia sinensis]